MKILNDVKYFETLKKPLIVGLHVEATHVSVEVNMKDLPRVRVDVWRCVACECFTGAP